MYATVSVTSAPATRPIMMAATGDTKAQAALLATRPPTQPLAQSEASGLPKRVRVMAGGGQRGADRGEHRVHDHERRTDLRSGEEQGARHVQAGPSHPGEQASEQNEDGVVAGDGDGHVLAVVLAAAGTENPGDGERGESADGLDGGGAAGIEKSMAEAVVDAQLREPSAAPDPVREERKIHPARTAAEEQLAPRRQRSAPLPSGISAARPTLQHPEKSTSDTGEQSSARPRRKNGSAAIQLHGFPPTLSECAAPPA